MASGRLAAGSPPLEMQQQQQEEEPLWKEEGRDSEATWAAQQHHSLGEPGRGNKLDLSKQLFAIPPPLALEPATQEEAEGTEEIRCLVHFDQESTVLSPPSRVEAGFSLASRASHKRGSPPAPSSGKPEVWLYSAPAVSHRLLLGALSSGFNIWGLDLKTSLR